MGELINLADYRERKQRILAEATLTVAVGEPPAASVTGHLLLAHCAACGAETSTLFWSPSQGSICAACAALERQP